MQLTEDMWEDGTLTMEVSGPYAFDPVHERWALRLIADIEKPVAYGVGYYQLTPG